MLRSIAGDPSAAFEGLRALAGCGGCAAKSPPALVAMLAGMAAARGGADAAVLAGLAPFDDAAVYALDDDRALVATVDFFPPLVDDPTDFGTVAAANAVSDIYAMGGHVSFALAISGFPAAVPTEVISAVSVGAADVIAACGGSILGGHSIRCREPVFGLCVLGFVDPRRIWRKSGARPGDALMLSKPVGTGLLLSAGGPAEVAAAVASMRTTNRSAAEALASLPTGPHAVTDITGYGLMGHALEVAERSEVTLEIATNRVPLLPGALNAAHAGVRTSAHAAQEFDAESRIDFEAAVPEALRALLRDPQTSGGLFAAVAPADVALLEARGFVRVGAVVAGPIRVRAVQT